MEAFYGFQFDQEPSLANKRYHKRCCYLWWQIYPVKKYEIRVEKVSKDQEKRSEKRTTWAFAFRHLWEN